jgi:uncharacterized protein YndB with AHSA1/START domain
MTIKRTATNPKLDLVLEREIDVPTELVWQAWTKPEHLMPWFCPEPWKVIDCTIDLRPGGTFQFVMCSPEGEKSTHTFCYLEVVEKKKIVWSSAVLPGFRPAPVATAVPDFTAIIEIEPHGRGTRYTATAMHRDEASCQKHDQMGFHEGWGKCIDQLEALLKR